MSELRTISPAAPAVEPEHSRGTGPSFTNWKAADAGLGRASAGSLARSSISAGVFDALNTAFLSSGNVLDILKTTSSLAIDLPG